MKIIQFIMKKVELLCNKFNRCDYEISYTGYYPREKKGCFLKSNFISIPEDDVLHFDLFTDVEGQYLVTFVKSTLFYVIPYTYAEFVIDFNGVRYIDNLITADQACEEIYFAKLLREGLHVIDLGKRIIFKGFRGNFIFNVGVFNYLFLGYDKP